MSKIQKLPSFFYDKYFKGSDYFKYYFKLKKILYLPKKLIFSFLKKKKVKVIIFDWGTKYCRNRYDIVEYAQKQKIPTLVIPHGMQIFTNPGENNKFTKQFLIKHKSSYNYPNEYILQSQLHYKQEINFGINKKIIKILGSARFDTQWIRELKKIYKIKNVKRKEKIIVFFLPHIGKNYVFNLKNILTILNILKFQKNIKILIKPHTRYLKNDFEKSIFYNTFKEKNFEKYNIELSYEDSFILSNKSDIIFFSGSSIFLDGFILNKNVINLSFIQNRDTIIDKSRLITNITSIKKFEKNLKNILYKKKTNNPNKKCKIIEDLLYGNNKIKKEGKVLEKYYSIIKKN